MPTADSTPGRCIPSRILGPGRGAGAVPCSSLPAAARGGGYPVPVTRWRPRIGGSLDQRIAVAAPWRERRVGGLRLRPHVASTGPGTLADSRSSAPKESTCVRDSGSKRARLPLRHQRLGVGGNPLPTLTIVGRSAHGLDRPASRLKSAQYWAAMSYRARPKGNEHGVSGFRQGREDDGFCACSDIAAIHMPILPDMAPVES